MKENRLIDLSFNFAVNIVDIANELHNKNEFVLSEQLLKSGTSIGANISEAQYAQSKLDFISKLQISLKEASETKYWLKLLFFSDKISESQYDDLNAKCKELIALLTASIKTSKSNL